MFYEERRTEAFWQFFYVFAGFSMIGLSFSIALFPLYLIFSFPKPWLIPLLSLTVIGGYGCMWFSKKFYRLFWKERHLSRYEVKNSNLEGITWRIEAGESVEQSFLLDQIEQVVFFPAIVRKTQPAPNTRIGKPTSELSPMLAIMTKEDSMEILFDARDIPEFEKWLIYFHERRIPISYTPKQLYWIGENLASRRERFELLSQPNETVPFFYTGDLAHDETAASQSWMEIHGADQLQVGPLQAFYVKRNKVMVWSGIGTLIGILLLVGSMLGIAAFT